MKRERRQHGMVRSYRILPDPWNPRPNSRFVNKFDSPPAAGLFVKVPSRPTNHSKFTGKCTRPRCADCHLHPACKSKDKTKGNNKNKSFDFAATHRLICWRVVDGQPGLNYSGLSATVLVDHLAHAYDDYDDDKCETGRDREREQERVVYDDGNHFISPAADRSNYENQKGNDNDGEENNDDKISFCQVGFECNQIEDGWCMVEEVDNP